MEHVEGKLIYRVHQCVCESLSARRLSTRGEGRMYQAIMEGLLVACNGGGGGGGMVFRGLIGMVVSTLCCSSRT